MLEFLKKFYIFMLILMVFSYLVPKEEYKKYIQFFIGIFVVFNCFYLVFIVVFLLFSCFLH